MNNGHVRGDIGLGSRIIRTDKSSTYSKDSEEDEKNHLEKVPIAIIRDLEHDQLSGTVRIHGLQRDSRNQSTKETPPHGLCREMIAHLFEREEDTSDRRTKGNSHTSSGGSRNDLS